MSEVRISPRAGYTLAQWLQWQENLHGQAIDLGLERVASVWGRLHPQPLPFPVVSVAGTNGKGSSVAMLEAVYQAAGYRVGCYTSPHLLRYNERIRLAGRDLADAVICDAFRRIDEARGDTSLTYFEFGTLAALLIFADAAPDLVVLEVGLGGRLDAVNIVDADIALITAISIDHVDWLGEDLQGIAREKAGIVRAGKPAIYSGGEPPTGLLEVASEKGALLQWAGHGFRYQDVGDGWIWESTQDHVPGSYQLPPPGLAGDFQLANAAGVVGVVHALKSRFAVSPEALAEGLQGARLAGRFQSVGGQPELLLDVAHNADSARVLAENLRDNPVGGPTIALFSLLRDKDLKRVVSAMDGLVEHWVLMPLDLPRASSTESLRRGIEAVLPGARVSTAQSVERALRLAREIAGERGRVVVFGSFHTVSAVSELL